MASALRSAVRQRAANCCEYCQRQQSWSPLFPLQIEHTIPRKHGGTDDFGNLALACSECNLHKSSNLTGIDPETNQITLLFNPRQQVWSDHFAWNGLFMVGLTPIGRTTIRVLELNSEPRLKVRRAFK